MYRMTVLHEAGQSGSFARCWYDAVADAEAPPSSSYIAEWWRRWRVGVDRRISTECMSDRQQLVRDALPPLHGSVIDAIHHQHHARHRLWPCSQTASGLLAERSATQPLASNDGDVTLLEWTVGPTRSHRHYALAAVSTACSIMPKTSGLRNSSSVLATLKNFDWHWLIKLRPRHSVCSSRPHLATTVMISNIIMISILALNWPASR